LFSAALPAFTEQVVQRQALKLKRLCDNCSSIVVSSCCGCWVFDVCTALFLRLNELERQTRHDDDGLLLLAAQKDDHFNSKPSFAAENSD
jgi:hypothetical protein